MTSTAAIPTDTGLLARLPEIGRQIGKKPLHHVSGIFHKKGVRVYAKKEWMQLSGSVKARAAFNIISKAVQNGALKRGKTLLDATSGNTGIAYASIAQKMGIPVTICLPENASPERKKILKSLGVNIVYTSKFEGTDGAQEVAAELANSRPDLYFYADQYKNEHNWRAHYQHTAVEILEAFPNVTHFVAGLGTTGTFMGTGRMLKAYNPDIKLIGLQPDSPMHGLEGWKHLETALTPGIYDSRLASSFHEIDTAEAYELIKAAKKHEGLFLSPSSAANLVGAIKVAEKLESGIVITVLPDNADKYTDVIKQLF